MDRRHFIRSTTILSLLPLSAAAVLIPPFPSAQAMEPAGSTFFIYDTRFPAAVTSAAEAELYGIVVPLQGDITRLWSTLLKSRSHQQSLTIVGVTTMSCHFCLQNLLREQSRVKSDTSRIDHDLLAWWITSQPRTQLRRG